MKPMKSVFSALRTITTLVVATLSFAASAQRAPYTVAVVPQFRAEEIHRVWAPLLERLGKETGQTFVLSVASSIPAFEEAMLAGRPDFAYMNPYHQVMGMRAQAYVPLLRDSKPLTGILVVRKDDPIKSVKELDGRQIAFPAPNAFGASLWIRALLEKREGIKIKPVYVKTHSNAYRHAATGLSAAAGGIESTLGEEPAEMQSALRVLLETPGVPPHPLSAHPRVPPATQRAVTEALLRMAADPSLKALMGDIPWTSVVRADYNRDYKPLEKFGLEEYVVRAPPP
jgi:phosphonate transport system substrate-binding protein